MVWKWRLSAVGRVMDGRKTEVWAAGLLVERVG